MRTKHHWFLGDPPHRHNFKPIIPAGIFPGVYMSCEMRCTCGATAPRKSIWVHT